MESEMINAVELFQEINERMKARMAESVETVVTNILDPMYKATSIREIRVTVKLKPDADDRSVVDCLIEVDTKLAKQEGVGARMKLTKGGVAQLQMFD